MARLPSVVVLLAIVAAITTAHAGQPCPSGRFLVTSPTPPPSYVPLVAIGYDAEGTVEIDGCMKTRARLRAMSQATRFRARWTPCGNHVRLQLRARIARPDCATLQGRFRGAGYPPTRVEAVRSTCGDGVLDPAGGEQCDASAPDGDAACPGACAAPPAAPCRCGATDVTPSGLSATVIGSAIALTWVRPDPATGFTDVRLLRRLGGPPSTASDPEAITVFAGSADAANEPSTALLPDTPATPRTYHYAVFACRPGGPCEPTGSRTTLSPTLVQLLAGGGYVIHWRHASANVCADATALGTAATTTSPDWWKSCESNCSVATARQLNAAGRDEATAMGSTLRARGIPFGRVITSEFCRNVETATLMDLGPTLEESPAITFFVHDEGNRCEASTALLADVPALGTNTAIIGHAGFPEPCPVLADLAWSEGAIFKPDGLGGSVLVTRLLWNEWSTLP